MYYKKNLSVKIISTSYFGQFLLCEVTCQNQKGYIVVIYRLPSQSWNEFEDFIFNLEKLTNQIKQLKPSFTISYVISMQDPVIGGQIISTLLKALILIL